MSHRTESGQEAQGCIVGTSSTCWWYCLARIRKSIELVCHRHIFSLRVPDNYSFDRLTSVGLISYLLFMVPIQLFGMPRGSSSGVMAIAEFPSPEAKFSIFQKPSASNPQKMLLL